MLMYLGIIEPSPEIVYINPNIEYVAEAKTIDLTSLSKIELISYFSDMYEISDEIPLAIAKAESDYQNVCNQEYGCIAGIGEFQIVQTTFDEQCNATGTPVMTNVYNTIDNVQCGVKMIADEHYFRWSPSMHEWYQMLSTDTKYMIDTLFSCVKGLRSFGVDLPIISSPNDLSSNSVCKIGAVALFNYPGNIGHGGLIIDMSPEDITLKETNYRAGQLTIRKIAYNDPYFRGCYDPIK